ncbi:unnamed protein product [Dovyalis caffra]|uniref:Uncharacterized protein n=1 Tax=Dovyalis caffra TaxID=77055 RepID=A0AAV1QP81_9ROSI|nr:unnamed protein product [Dovyalis caffra]
MWDDSIDDSPEGTRGLMKRFHLDSPKRKAVSPLKKHELARFVKRRKPKKWSLEEEDALREAVKKYGKGNWKLIWNSRRDVFQERTEVNKIYHRFIVIGFYFQGRGMKIMGMIPSPTTS